MSIISAALKRAGHKMSEAAEKTLETIERDPELMLGPAGVAIAGIKNLAEGRNLVGARSRKPRPPLPGGHRPSKLYPLLQAAKSVGRPVAGTQPYMFAGYFTLAAASAITKDVDIADLFTTTNTPLFTTSDKFPVPFQAEALRLCVITEPIDPAKEDAAWVETLYAVFAAQTEIARLSLNQLGLRTVISGAVVTSGGGNVALIDADPGTDWPVFYDPNGTYKMSVRSATAIASTSKPLAMSYALDGWMIQDPAALDQDESDIISAIGALFDL